MISLSIDLKAPVITIASRNVVSAKADMQIGEMVEFMIDHGYRRIPIAENRRLQGIVSSMDIMEYLIAGKDLRRPVGTIMTRKVFTIEHNETVGKALFLMKEYRKGAYPVVRNGFLEGIISDADMIKAISGPVGITVEEIMTSKPVIVKQHYMIAEAAKILVRGGFRRLPVVDSQKRLVGIITPFDIINFLLKGRRLDRLGGEKTPIGSIMAKKLITVQPDIDVYHAVRVILDKGVGGLPVVEEGNMVGIVTENDIVRLL